jgi:monofunctional biosynthetic peptidoglycan transglycosylase
MNSTWFSKPRLKKIARVLGIAAAVFFGSTLLWVIALKWINPPTTFLQLTTSCPAGVQFHKEWVDAEHISNNMKLAVVASEDNNFMKHGGIDWGAVEKAKKYNETEGKRKGKYRGASTITQQTAKNVFLWPGQSKFSKWIRKAFEVYFTYLIEWIWGKDRIMEVYLNVIEMGPCKFGVGAAAKDYFGVSASALSREQAALIAACLPNPKKYSVAKPGAYMKKRQSQIARLMRLIGDDYFKRYGSEVAQEEREARERDVEEELKKLPDDEVPSVVDESSSSDESKEETNPESNEPAVLQDAPVVEDAQADTSSSN